VHVWRADLHRVSASLVEVLSPGERERARQIISERRRSRWMRSRAVLRELLARYAECDPAQLELWSSSGGGLRLGAEPDDRDAVRLSVSHSGGLALYAFSRTVAVGVDVELSRRSFDEAALAARTAGPDVARALAQLDGSRRRRAFLQAWVRYEARLKWQSAALERGTSSAHEPLITGSADPWIAAWELARGAAALAVDEAPRELRLWRWRPRAADRAAPPR